SDRPAGAPIMRQVLTVQSAPVASLRVGTSGSGPNRLSPMLASGRTLPASINCMALDRGGVTMSTAPDARSFSDGASPCDGTHGTLLGSTPSFTNQPAKARCQMPPVPVPDALKVLAGSVLRVARSAE